MPDTYLLQKFSFLYSADRFHGIAHLKVVYVNKLHCEFQRVSHVDTHNLIDNFQTYSIKW